MGFARSIWHQNKQTTPYTNLAVIEAWIAGEIHHSKNWNLSTDGQKLWSYRMEIGKTFRGVKFLLNVRGGFSYSITTTSHVSLAAWREGVVLVNPIRINGWRMFPDDDVLKKHSQPLRIHFQKVRGYFP